MLFSIFSNKKFCELVRYCARFCTKSTLKPNGIY